MQGWIQYTPDIDKNGFRILLLEIENHNVLARGGDNCRLELFNYDQENDISISTVPYSTVIIGRNGIGKSFILSALADIFRYLKSLQENDQDTIEPEFRFAIQYFLNGHCYKVLTLARDNEYSGDSWRFLRTLNCWEDDEHCPVSSIMLPTAVLASSVSINDRFRTQKTQDGFYWYLGTRNENSPSTTGTKTIVRKTVSAIAECLSHGEYFRDNLKSLLEYLNLEPRMEIEYSFRYRKVYLSQRMTNEEFNYIFDHWKDRFEESGSKRKEAPWGHKKYPHIRDNEENVSLIVNFLNKIIDNDLLGARGRLQYSLRDNSLAEDWKAIKLLTELDIITYPSIRVYKKDSGSSRAEYYPFEESSSGETNMLCQFISILARIEHHGLVLIDEPETSAHPNWQIRYIDWLNKIFSRFNTCHFIISTHSHLLLSGLEQGSSSVVALKKEGNRVENISEGVDTSGWTADDILYEVFNVRNPMNTALERDLERAVQLIDEKLSGNENEINELLKRFNKVYRGVRDPLGALIKELEGYAKSRQE